MLNRFILGMLTQKYRYVKRYLYVLEEQRDTRESRRGFRRGVKHGTSWHRKYSDVKALPSYS